MTRIPRFWRRFKRLLTVHDLMRGRKVVITTNLDDGGTHYSIERVRL